ncbi:MAG: endonuclease/exonuclease/phosphatase family protein [Bacteroidota bacterium]
MKQETEPTRKKTGRTRIVLLLTNVGLALLLFLAQTLTTISPARYWILELFTNSYPILLLLNLCFIAFWLLRKSKFALISSVVLLFGLGKIGEFFQPGFHPSLDTDTDSTLHVLSYNVRSFDLYNWTGNAETRRKIFEMLESEQPQLLCLQEYYSCDEGEFQNTTEIARRLKLPYQHIRYSNTVLGSHHWGLATFSKYPIVQEGALSYKPGKSNFIQFTDLLIDADTVRVYNLHLQSNHFKKQDYEFIENPDDTVHKGWIQGSKSILRKLRKAVVTRSQQADTLANHIRECPHPVIVCGDFNDTPFTYTYRTAKGDLVDAFVEKGKGFGGSYTELPLPLRIDYVLHSSDIATTSFEMQRNRLSDHYPLIVGLRLPN